MAASFGLKACRSLFKRPVSRFSTYPLTKIVATIGPASEQLPMLTQVCDAGLNIMRINFSHATYEEADLRVTNLRKCKSIGQKSFTADDNLRGVMLDTQGPEIRTGSFASGVKEVELTKGNKVVLTTDPNMRNNQSADTVWVSYQSLLETVSCGDMILLDDGAIELKVEDKSGANSITCTVQNTGVLGNKKGVNLPGLAVALPAMCEKDRADIRWGIKNDIDYIAASFTRKASDVTEIRQYTDELMKEFYGENHGRPLPKIIAKIENTEALDNFDSILEETDGIMVARGDLGVEIPMEKLAFVQKEIVRKSIMAGKPVVVATQMLESMQKNPRPTRAECTDVANAVFEGSDCVMLSGESAKGKYPVKSVQMMQNIIKESEKWFKSELAHNDYHYQHTYQPGSFMDSNKKNFEYLGMSIATAVDGLQATCIVVLSKSGQTASNIARFRPNVPVVTFVPNAKLGRMLQVHRAIIPMVTPSHWADLDDSVRVDQALNEAKACGFCKAGDHVVVVSGEPQTKDRTSTLKMRVTHLA